MTHILCLEDDPVISLLIKTKLTKSGYTIDTADNGETGLALLTERHYDLVILDHQMPAKSGLEVLEAMHYFASPPPTIMLSGANSLRVAVDAIKLGAVDFLPKDDSGDYLELLPHTVERALEHALLHKEQFKAKEQQRLTASVFKHTFEGIVITDDQCNILQVNDAFTRITGYSFEECIGRKTSMLSSGYHDAAFYQRMWLMLKGHGRWCGEVWNRRKNGEIYPEWLSINAVQDEQGLATHFIATLTDITDRKQSEEHLLYLAHYDVLTGLPNRELFTDRIEHALANAYRQGEQVALLFIDLDHFKQVNDTLGHSAGDELLRQVAQRLKNNIRENDTAARLSGDEFTVILEHFHHRQDVEILTRKLLTELSLAYSIKGREVTICASIGIAFYPNDAEEIEKLIRCADQAMYKAKENGRNTHAFYAKEDVNLGMSGRFTVENDLRTALENDQFVLHYQPQFDMVSQRIVGFEALLRWQHPQQGLISPAKFIDILEDSSLILPVGEWVLRTACQRLKTLQENGHQGLRMAVNLSARQYRRYYLAETIDSILAETGIDPNALELEVTEGTLIRNIEDTVGILQAIHERGIHISVDDFGTGYSSLSHLRHLPIDTLKIDQSFVKNCHENASDRAIISGIISLAHNMGLKVIAEGIETAEHYQFLKSLHCQEGQGYYLSKPLPSEKLEQMLDS
jgi:diguanylate cyclase (GGDEF)-like protein/PAS domain S-box-containing protein